MPKIGSLSKFLKFDLLLTSTDLWWNLFLWSKCHILCWSMLSYEFVWKKCVPEFFSRKLPLFDLDWPRVTSREFSCQNFMVYFSQGYHMSIHTKICDLWWPQMTSWVKIILPSGSRISYENVCWKLGPWVHFSKFSVFDL